MQIPKTGDIIRLGPLMKILLISVVSFVFLLILGVAGVIGYTIFFGIPAAYARLDAVPLAPANYQPAALELVKLCQSDPSFFSKEAIAAMGDPVWAPPSVAKLNPEDLDIDADHATVIWGGGFYHCGWKLARGPAGTDDSSHSWTLTFFSESKPSKVLETITVASDQRFTKDEFVNYVLAEIDRRLAPQGDPQGSTEAEWYLPAARCLFLARYRRLDLLPAQVRKSAANYPHDWRDALLCYLLDHASGNHPPRVKLNRWAAQSTGPAAWIFAAYAFYQAGETTDAEDAINKALASTSPDPDWIDDDIDRYELGMAARLYRSGRFDRCAHFCDGVLQSRHQIFQNRSSVLRIRDWAAATAASRPAKLPAFDKYTSLDPFGGFDLGLLKSAASSSAHATSRPGS
jgi:hypothetical protein